mmetsp:Transcript_27208/g.59019  ORF Transcript_27208/g.59019 Transcript_27208/m.59019 type:complete len:241 (-) Transcript_27208:495-1217(-)
MSSDAGIFAQQHPEPCLGHGGLNFLVARIVYGTYEGHGTVDVIDVDGVGGVVVIEEDPVEVGELGSRFEDAVDFLEDCHLVLHVSKGLNLIRSIKRLIRKGQLIIQIPNPKIGNIPQPNLHRIMSGIVNLRRIQINTLHRGTRGGGGMHGNPSPPTADIENLFGFVGTIGHQSNIGHHLLLVEILVGHETNGRIPEGGNVHFFDIPHGAKVVDDVVVVDNVGVVLAVVVGPVAVEEDVAA